MAFAVILAAGTGAAMAARPAAPTARPDPVATVKRLTGELDLQTRLPSPKDEKPPAPPSDLRWDIPDAKAILWGALAVGVAVALFALRDRLFGFRRRIPDPPAAPAVEADVEAVERMADTGDEADEMARLGRVREAMHLLLLRALAEMRARLGITLADSLTSREILDRVALADDGRQALRELIGRVELAHFGGRSVVADDYRACRASFERLVGAMLTPPPAAVAA